MNRRHFLAGAVSGMAAAALASPAAAFAAPKKFARAFRQIPDSGLPRRPMRLIAGKRPEGFTGTYFLNGPAKHERGGVRNEHWFDGDGMVNAFRFGDEAPTHEGRFVETPKFRAEKDAGRFLYPGFDMVPEDPAAGMSPDDSNAANISVLPVGDQLWALWEGGSPTALSPDDLATEGLVDLGGDLTGVPFSAHPRVDPQGRIWGFGNSAFTGQLLLYELAADGTVVRANVLGGFPKSMVHDFAATDRHLIVGFAPYHFDKFEGAYVDRFGWYPDKPRVYVVIEKETLEVSRRYELPAAFVFHHFNGWTERDGTIRLAACTYDNVDFIEQDARQVMAGEPFSGHNEAFYEHLAFYPDGRVTAEREDTAAEFPVCDPRLAGGQAPTFHVSRDGNNRFGNAIMARDPGGEVTGRWSTEPDTIFGEHIVIPRPDGKNWLIGTQFDATRGRSLVSLFDGGDISAGPVAIWETPDLIPLPLHGCWVA